MSVRTTVGVVHLVLAALGGLAMIGNAVQRYVRSTQSRTAPAPAMLLQIDDDQLLAKIAQYKTWTRVNPKPEMMELTVSQSCKAQVPGTRSNSPHQNKYLTVFVNGDGTPAMMEQKFPTFPVGSIVIKEKLNDWRGGQPELLTAMVKREAGYNPASGDWEYLVLDGTASTITERGKLASCNTCHTAYQNQDFITRTYLPVKVRTGLK